MSPSAQPTGTATPRLKIGALVGSHGIGGGLRVRLYDEQTQALAVGRRVVLESNSNGRLLEATITRVAQVAGDPMVKLWVHEVGDRTSADGWQGAVVSMDRSQLPPLQDGEFYLADAIGKPALLLGKGVPLGVIQGVTSNGAQDLLMVLWSDAAGRTHEWMLPALRPFLHEMTAEGLWVTVPEGFLPDDLERALGRDGALVAEPLAPELAAVTGSTDKV